MEGSILGLGALPPVQASATYEKSCLEQSFSTAFQHSSLCASHFGAVRGWSVRDDSANVGNPVRDEPQNILSMCHVFTMVTWVWCRPPQRPFRVPGASEWIPRTSKTQHWKHGDRPRNILSMCQSASLESTSRPQRAIHPLRFLMNRVMFHARPPARGA